MFRRSVSGACLFLPRLSFSGASLGYRSAFSRSLGLRIPADRVARARMASFAVNATPIREYSDILHELESRLSVRSSAVVIQARRASSTPESTRQERAADTQTQGQGSAVSSAEGQGSDGKASKAQQLRKVFKEYGAVGVSFHVGISLISLGIFYLAVSSGLDVAALLCRLGFSESVVQSRLAAGTSTFVLAYAVHKLFAPLRISVTLVCVPLIVRRLRKTGLFKPRASGP